MKTIYLVAIFVMLTISAKAQENDNEKSKKQKDYPLNTVTIGVGRSSEISEFIKFSNVGFDYLRRFNPNWEGGVQLDLDFATNFEDFEGVQLAGIVAYSITNKWPVFAGVAFAKEHDKVKTSLRLGTEYTFFVDKANKFFLAPGTFLDANLDGVTWSVMVAFGMVW